MGLEEYRETLTLPLRQVALCFLVREDRVLLAMKKRGHGEGKWNGVGGKAKPGETVEDAAIREMQEEIGVTPLSLQRVASLDFYFPHSPEKSQQAVVFLIVDWRGEPTESDEMEPKWFEVSGIPFESMWPFDDLWISRVLTGELIRGEFLFGPNNEPLESKITTEPKVT